MADPPFTSAEFHTVAQKQVMNVLYETMLNAKLDWSLIEPMIESARELCRSEFQRGGRVRFHTLKPEGDQWVEAEEAFLGISVTGPEDGREWLAETYWISDLALADGPEQARAVIAALERSLERIRSRLEKGEDAPAALAPPEEK